LGTAPLSASIKESLADGYAGAGVVYRFTS